MTSREARVVALVVVALVYASDLFGTGFANHVFGTPPEFPSFAEEGLETGVREVDEALSRHLADANQTIGTVRAALHEPQVPATYYYDGAEDQVGGIGSASNHSRGTVTTSWHRHADAAHDGPLGYRFSDPGGTRYVLGIGGAFIDDYLFTPRLSLRGLEARAGRAGAGGETAATPPGMEATETVRLSLWHKYNFASNKDGARIEVFSNLPTADQAVVPLAVLAPSITSSEAIPMDAVDAFSGQPAGDQGYTGQQPVWVEAVFDLSPWIGQEIYLGFHVGVTAPVTGRGSYFRNTANFPAPLDFAGWRIDTVRVEGPAHLHNLRLYSVNAPAPNAHGEWVAPSGPRLDGDYYETRAVIENRGSFTERTKPRLSIEPLPGGPCMLQGDEWSQPLVPGENRVAVFRCPSLADGIHYQFTFTAPLDADQDPGDNQQAIRVFARRIVAITVLDDPFIDPVIGETTDVRRLAIRLKNNGNDAERVDLRLVLLKDGVPVTGPRFSIESPGSMRVSVRLEPGQTFSPTPWRFLLGETGGYDVTVQVLVRGELAETWSRVASSRVSIPRLYQDSHLVEAGAVGPAIRGEPKMTLLPDPISDPPGPDEWMWTLPGPDLGASGFPGASSLPQPMLTGRVAATRADLGRSFTGIEIEMTHFMRGAINPTLVLTLGDAWDQVEVPFSGGRPAGLAAFEKPQDFALFYAAQWVPEHIVVPAERFRAQAQDKGHALSEFPPGSLNGLQVAAWGGSWRIADILVRAVAADGSRLTLMRTGGLPESDEGTWTPRSQCLTETPACTVPQRVQGGAATSVSHWRRYSPLDLVLPEDFHPVLGDLRTGFWWKGEPIPDAPVMGRVKAGDYSMLVTPPLFVDPGAPEPRLAYWDQFASDGNVAARILVRFPESEEPDLFYPLVPPPRINSVGGAPSSTLGGESLPINGIDFRPGARVFFDGIEAEIQGQTGSFEIKVLTPPNDPGPADVTVRNEDGQEGHLLGAHTYRQYPPKIQSLTPPTGSTNGGVTVTIHGTGFGSPAQVFFGESAATDVITISESQIRFVLPPRSAMMAGPVSVQVTNPDGQTVTKGQAFTYDHAPKPSLGGVDPQSGPSRGGTGIRITGQGFAPGATVTLGSSPAKNVNVISPILITAVTPHQAAGLVRVLVNNPDGQATESAVTATNSFSFLQSPPPTISTIAPSGGPSNGGTEVTIRGSNFVTGAGVIIGSAAATNALVVNSNLIRARVPPRSTGGPADVEVRNPDSTTGRLSAGFTYDEPVPPTIATLTPNEGPTNGGTVVTVEGTNFGPGLQVFVGFNLAKQVSVQGATRLTFVTSPCNCPGAKDVMIRNPDNQQAVTNAGEGFAYLASPAPLIDALFPNFGPVAGGTLIDVHGQNFAPGAAIDVFQDGSAEENLRATFLSPNQLRFHMPPSPRPFSEARATLRIQNPDLNAFTLHGAFTYTFPPPPQDRWALHEVPLGNLVVVEPRIRSADGPLPTKTESARGRLIQFAFLSGEPTDLRINRGWYVGAITLEGGRLLANDVQVVSADLHTDYDDDVPELGPASVAVAELTLRNVGIFSQSQIEVEVVFIEPAAVPLRTHSTKVLLPSDTKLGSQEEKRFVIPVTIPHNPGSYIVQARARLVGEASDENPNNNCVTLGNRGQDSNGCVVGPLTDRHSVQSVASLRIERATEQGNQDGLEIVPRAGRADFPRLFLINLRNTGNVIVHDFEIQRTITRFSGGPPNTRTENWRVAESMAPGRQADWTTLPLSPAAIPVRTLGDAGRYLVVVQVLLPVEGSTLACASVVNVASKKYCELDRVQAIAESFATFLSDRFDATSPSRDPAIIRGGFEADGPGFQLTDHVDQSGRGGSWWYGDSENQSYPQSDSSVLRLPSIDLSRAQAGYLSFLFNSSLERGYDGILLEAAPDGGDEWIPLLPIRTALFDPAFLGYPGPIAASNPLHPDGDPTRSFFGFTGETRGLVEAGGWVPIEFNLASIPGFSQDTVLDRFTQATMDPAEAPRPDSSVPGLSRATGWRLPGESCPRCWARENVRAQEPRATDGSRFWWTGTGTPMEPSAPYHQRLIVPLDLRDLPQRGDEQVRLAFENFGVAPTGTWPLLSAELPETPRVRIRTATETTAADVRPLSQLENGWTSYEIDLAAHRGSRIQLEFVFQKTLHQAATPQDYGWGIGRLTIERFREPVPGQRTGLQEQRIDDSLVTNILPSQSADCNGNALPRCLDVGWRLAGPQSPPLSPEARWHLDDTDGPAGAPERAWSWSCDPLMAGSPGFAHERLLSPALDLRRVGGATATATYWRSGTVQPRIQTFDPVINAWSAPKPPATAPTTIDSGSAWTREQIDLSPYIGAFVRIAFTVAPGPTCPFGNTWHVTGLLVEGETLVGRPIQLRLRAGSDASVNEGGWGFDELQIVGLLYADNVAILLEDARAERQETGQQPIVLRGKVRNLSGQTLPAIFLDVTARPRLADATPPSLQAKRPETVNRPDPTRGDWIRFGPFPLLPGGTAAQGADELPFEIEFQAPAGVAVGSAFDVNLELLQSLGSDQPPAPWRDENMADHQRQTTIEVRPRPLLRVAPFDVTPRSQDNLGPVTLSLHATNEGNTPDTILLTPRIRKLGDPLFVAPHPPQPLRAAPEPDAPPLTVTWAWTPPGPGTYAFDIEALPSYTTLPSRQQAGYFFVADPPIYYQENFDTETIEDWSHQVTNADSCDGDDQWQTTSEDAFNPPTSYRLGVSRNEFNPPNNQRYAPFQESRLISPIVDLAKAWDAGLDPDDPVDDHAVTTPHWNFRYLRRLATDDGIVLEARALDPARGLRFRENIPTTLEPDDGYDTPMPGRTPDDFDATGCPFVPQAIGGSTRQGADHAGWETMSIPLGDRPLPLKLLGERAEFSYRFNSNLANEEQGFYLDAVSVSAYRSRFDPPIQHANLVDNASKSYHFKLTNDGNATDTFHLAIVPSLTNLPNDVSLELSADQVQLDQGESGLVEVRLTTPLNRFQRTGPGPVVGIASTSEHDPNRIGLGHLVIDRYHPRAWPDLKASLGLAAGTKPSLTAGEPTVLRATIENRGLGPSRPTSLILLACPGEAASEATIIACRDQLRTSGAAPLLIAERRIPVLPSLADVGPSLRDRTRATFAVEWTPPRDLRGPLTILALADPGNRLIEYDETDNAATLGLHVLGTQKTDVAIASQDFEVRDPQGRLVHESKAGTRLSIRAVFENRGLTSANNVLLRLTNQFVLRETRIASMPPQGRVELTTTWIAIPGTWLVTAEAIVPQVEADNDNNRAVWPLAIRESGLRIVDPPPTLFLELGSTRTIRHVLENVGDTPQEIQAQTVAEGPIEAAIVPRAAHMEPGETLDFHVTVTATSAAAPASILIAFVSTEPGGPTATHSLDVRVRAGRSILVQAEPVTPGTAAMSLQLQLRNAGALTEQVTLTATGPPRWRIEAPQEPIRLLAGELALPALRLAIPPDYAPGDYMVRVFIDSVFATDAPIHVQPVKALTLRLVSQQTSAMNEADFLLEVTNRGNVPTPASLLFDNESDSQNFYWRPLEEPLAPGQSAVIAVFVNAAAGPPARVTLDDEFFAGPPVLLELKTAANPALISDWSRDPPDLVAKPGQVVASRIRLASEDIPAPAMRVSLYDNGALADSVNLAAHDSDDYVTLNWVPTKGTHVLTILLLDAATAPPRILDSRSELVDIDGPALAASPGLVFIVAAAALALQFGQRRRTP